VGGNIHASRAWKGENMNFASYFVAPWFIKVLFLFILFTLPVKEYEIASLSLHYIQGFGSMTSFSVTLSDSEGFKRDCHAFGSQMTVKRLAMTVKEGSRW
jgi:hypothetical protein